MIVQILLVTTSWKESDDGNLNHCLEANEIILIFPFTYCYVSWQKSGLSKCSCFFMFFFFFVIILYIFTYSQFMTDVIYQTFFSCTKQS